MFENRPIKTYFITPKQLQTVPLRRPPKVTGQIRAVEVEVFDYSACGGTHCPSTGMIGLIKIVKTERKNKKLRLYFVTGQQALTTFQHYQQVVTDLCQQLNTRPEEVVRLVNRHMAQLATAEREIRSLQAEVLSFEAQQLNAQAEPIGGIVRLVTKLYPNQSMSQLHELAKQLPAQDDLVAVLGGTEGQKLSLVVSCAAGTAISARELLAHYLAQIKGQGSGDARLAQDGGNATPEQVEQLLARTGAYLDS